MGVRRTSAGSPVTDMKACLDTSAINWLADNTGAKDAVQQARQRGLLEIVVTPEAAVEVRATKDLARRSLLKEVLSRFFPLAPARIPRLGATRLALARCPTADDEKRLAAVSFLRDGADRQLVVNAAGYGVDVFVTGDKEMYARKRDRLEGHLSGTRVVDPPAFLSRSGECSSLRTVGMRSGRTDSVSCGRV